MAPAAWLPLPVAHSSSRRQQLRGSLPSLPVTTNDLASPEQRDHKALDGDSVVPGDDKGQGCRGTQSVAACNAKGCCWNHNWDACMVCPVD
jgi:hypothetical protein